MALYRTTMPTQTDYSAQNQAGLAARQAQLAQRAAGEQQRQAAMTAANQAARPAPAPSLSSMMRDYVNAPSPQMGSLRSLTPEEMARVRASQQRTAAMDPEEMARARAAAQAQLQAHVDAQRAAMGGSPAAPALANANPNAAFNRAGNPLGRMMTGGLPPSYLSANPELQRQIATRPARGMQMRPGGSPGFGDDTGPYRGVTPPGALGPVSPTPPTTPFVPPPGAERSFGANKSPPSAPPGAPQGAGSPERDAYLRRQAFAQRLAAPRSPTG